MRSIQGGYHRSCGDTEQSKWLNTTVDELAFGVNTTDDSMDKSGHEKSGWVGGWQEEDAIPGQGSNMPKEGISLTCLRK
jgi:hypothetical protein